MPTWLRVMRWIIAFPVGVVVSVFVVAMVSVLWRHLGGNSRMMYYSAVMLGTFACAVVGGFVAPPDQRRIAARGIVAGVVMISAILLVISLAKQTFEAANVYDVMGSLLGGMIALRCFNRLA